MSIKIGSLPDVAGARCFELVAEQTCRVRREPGSNCNIVNGVTVYLPVKSSANEYTMAQVDKIVSDVTASLRVSRDLASIVFYVEGE